MYYREIHAKESINKEQRRRFPFVPDGDGSAVCVAGEVLRALAGTAAAPRRPSRPPRCRATAALMSPRRKEESVCVSTA